VVLTRLSPWGPDRHHPLKLALSCRRFPRLSGLDGPPPRDRRRKRLKLGRNVTFLRNARGTFGQRSRTRPVAASSTKRSHRQRTSFHTLGTRLGPEMSLASPAFLCSAKAAGSPPQPTSAWAPRGATVNDRDTAPKASLTVASTVLRQIGHPEEGGKRPQRYEASGKMSALVGETDILCPSGTLPFD
jgi:hypothetical protein